VAYDRVKPTYICTMHFFVNVISVIYDNVLKLLNLYHVFSLKQTPIFAVHKISLCLYFDPTECVESNKIKALFSVLFLFIAFKLL
jgi:hypothetical protein